MATSEPLVIKTDLTSEQIENMTVAPGWVLIEPIQPKGEVKTTGGLFIPQQFDHNSALLSYGRVVRAGIYFHQQCGEVKMQGWPDKVAGKAVIYHPHNPWQVRGVGERVYLLIKSIDVMTVFEAEEIL